MHRIQSIHKVGIAVYIYLTSTKVDRITSSPSTGRYTRDDSTQIDLISEHDQVE